MRIYAMTVPQISSQKKSSLHPPDFSLLFARCCKSHTWRNGSSFFEEIAHLIRCRIIVIPTRRTGTASCSLSPSGFGVLFAACASRSGCERDVDCAFNAPNLALVPSRSRQCCTGARTSSAEKTPNRWLLRLRS